MKILLILIIVGVVSQEACSQDSKNEKKIDSVSPKPIPTVKRPPDVKVPQGGKDISFKKFRKKVMEEPPRRIEGDPERRNGN